ncbi:MULTISPECIES: hypothetical protein [Neorhizobium]|jgi:hypothetical protein|uniref:hypothetical protein n=1 Tax=Neorhizobium sp. T6_25 TaxID=2093833 RepID=UPI00155F4589|nr:MULTISPECIES: hypothetical protein [Neorhizobium]
MSTRRGFDDPRRSSPQARRSAHEACVGLLGATCTTTPLACRCASYLYFLSMGDISPPTVPAGNEKRHLFCQLAIEIPMQDLIQAAVKAG